MNVVVFDTETTGLEWKVNSIVSLGAVDLTSGDEFYKECKIIPGSETNLDALKVNGFSKEQVLDENKCSPKELLIEFSNWLDRHKCDVLCGFNVLFDLKFILGIVKKYNLDWNLPVDYIDLEAEFVNKIVNVDHFKNLRAQTDALYPSKNGYSSDIKINYISMNRALKFFSIADEPNPHNALGGAKYACELYALMYDKSHFLRDFDKYVIPLEFRNYKIDKTINKFDYRKLLD